MTQSASRAARPCDDILTMIGLEVETRRSMDKVVGQLNEISECSGNGMDWDGLYYHFQDEGWWEDMRWCVVSKTPKWLEALPAQSFASNWYFDVYE